MKGSEKILPLTALAAELETARAGGRTVVLCHGTFDLMHAGHIKHLQRARAEGDLLVVTVTADAFVNKGPGRPVFHEELRAESLAALGCVDFVAVNREPTAINVIEQLKPDVYVKGGEYRNHGDDVTGNIAKEVATVHAHGGRVFYTDEITFSSTRLLNQFFGIFPEETRRYLDDFKQHTSAEQVIEQLKRLAGMRVLVVGDAIVDEYHYTSPMGQTGKGNVLAVRYDSAEQFAGGAMAVANHVAGFAREVTLATVLGEHHSFEELIRAKLRPNVESKFFLRGDDQTLVKRRFVDPDMAKLFEIYFYSDRPLPEPTEAEFAHWLDAHLPGFDAVIVPDFGNGCITPRIVAALAKGARFLAVNTQVNSGNRGYHVVTRYPRADFVALNEPELRLATHNRHDPLARLAREMSERLGARALAATLGTKGVLFHEAGDGHFHVPALSTNVIDRVGAGDAFLSLAGLCMAAGLPGRLSAFIGSTAAALGVQTVCNREPVDPVSLCKYVTTLLK